MYFRNILRIQKKKETCFKKSHRQNKLKRLISWRDILSIRICSTSIGLTLLVELGNWLSNRLKDMNFKCKNKVLCILNEKLCLLNEVSERFIFYMKRWQYGWWQWKKYMGIYHLRQANIKITSFLKKIAIFLLIFL